MGVRRSPPGAHVFRKASIARRTVLLYTRDPHRGHAPRGTSVKTTTSPCTVLRTSTHLFSYVPEHGQVPNVELWDRTSASPMTSEYRAALAASHARHSRPGSPSRFESEVLLGDSMKSSHAVDGQTSQPQSVSKPPYAALWKSSICRIQLVSGFHLGKIWATTRSIAYLLAPSVP